MEIYTLTLHRRRSLWMMGSIIIEWCLFSVIVVVLVVDMRVTCVCVWVYVYICRAASAIRQLEQAIVVTGAQSFRHI